MSNKSMSLVFSGRLMHYLPEDWYKAIQQNHEVFRPLRVISLSRIKDLNSAWAHEYMRFVVENEESKERAPVYAERGVSQKWINSIPQMGLFPIIDPDAVDGVTIGFNESGNYGRWTGLNELPLFLESYIYTDKKPSFISLAETIARVSKEGGTYNLLGNNCYWFAYTTMKDYAEKNKGTTKKVYAKIGGTGGGGLRDLISFFISLPYKYCFPVQQDVERFKYAQRKGQKRHLTDALLPLPQAHTPQLRHIDQLKDDRSAISGYAEILKENYFSVDEAAVRSFFEKASRIARVPELLNDQFDEDVRDLEGKIVAAMSNEEKKDMYKRIKQKVSSSAPDDSGITAEELGLNEPQARQYHLVQELVKIFSDTVIAETGNQYT